MNVLFACSEAVPFAKTGGLADVCGALPLALERVGAEPSVIMPAYRDVVHSAIAEPTGVEFDIPLMDKAIHGSLLRGSLPGSSVPVFFVRQDEYFNRPQLYREGDRDYPDNCERFVFFCRAVVEAMRLLDLKVDLVHCHDWQAGLIPAYLHTDYQNTRGFERIRSLLTIHNLAYQGLFPREQMPLTGLDWQYFNWRQMEYYGQLNLLKTGLVFADALSTVSQRYSEEIQTSEFGCGLEGVLQERRDQLTGIPNGISYEEWDPATDRHLKQNFDVGSWREGKSACKADVQESFGLPVNSDVLLVGLIGRLADQKGWDLVVDVMNRWVDRQDVQWAVLGTGEPRYEDQLSRLRDRHPDRVAVRLEFSEALAHQVEAGADAFLMPSRYEPCGLNQLYSLRYGAVPIVRATGGLYDTICNATDETLATKRANGFTFESYTASALEDGLQRACRTYLETPETWAQLVVTGMQQDWSWAASARRYLDLYTQLCDRSVTHRV